MEKAEMEGKGGDLDGMGHSADKENLSSPATGAGSKRKSNGSHGTAKKSKSGSMAVQHPDNVHEGSEGDDVDVDDEG